jgi:sugar phosphate isomerase/epimerase
LQIPTSRRTLRGTQLPVGTGTQRLAVSQATTRNWPLEFELARLPRLGVAAIGLLRHKLPGLAIDRATLRMLRASGLAVSSLSCVGGFTGTESWSWEDAVLDAREAISLAAELQAECLVAVPGRRGGHTRQHARKIVADALRCLAPLAAGHDLQIALQPVHRLPAATWSAVPDLEAAVEVLERSRCPNVGLAFDTFHLAADPQLFQRIPELARWIKLVILSDAHESIDDDRNRCLPDEGILPLERMIATLESAGYRGRYELHSAQPFSKISAGDAALSRALTALERLAPRTFDRGLPAHSHAALVPQS